MYVRASKTEAKNKTNFDGLLYEATGHCILKIWSCRAVVFSYVIIARADVVGNFN